MSSTIEILCQRIKNTNNSQKCAIWNDLFVWYVIEYKLVESDKDAEQLDEICYWLLFIKIVIIPIVYIV